MIAVKFYLIVALLLARSAYSQQPADFKPYEQTLPGTSIKFTMTPIAGGTYTMGAASGEAGAQAFEGPQKKVTISPFWMGTHEVTHDEFNVFFEDEGTPTNSTVDAITKPTSQYIDLTWGMGKTGGFPANSMQQFTALMYCRWLYNKTGQFYRLPTEAEWEYAARAGATTTYPFGNDAAQLNDYAWTKANSNKVYHRVGQKKPNAWGLYDMLGNVAEWTIDQFDEQYYSKVADGATDPVITPEKRHPKGVRGGSFEDDAAKLRPASRLSWLPDWNKRDPQIPKSRWWLTDGHFVGFRLVRPYKQPTQEEAEAFFQLHLGQ
ncbi:Formylglycine-generating enzyme, required for sulfatase activity, contains SUMF1/FGE domain [Cnuella takakiae]|uniref:Formylglycine-generating enzyme, required for sulfatase activity, contains SUMF1/FGE domain n=1 Tax=Cnuella takakiae TaxID=1302690 RepID=A0A1M5DF22_9BACT|nr:formylglycine-generating enzyme family protein [Cnuella takakiae]OLY93990.1 sulfatase-modifying factor [Cnuella takakiae]SHF65526.1 Formylglycine-generating enzyme, required for sulfatase activity, contains SUMF1/FGE domain [Cnuella takakiae]